MIIIVPPGVSPTLVGVAQVGEKFFPISNCCSVRLHTYGSAVNFHCSKCSTPTLLVQEGVTPTSLSLDESMTETYSEVLLTLCVSQWTGWSGADIDVKVGIE